jgi:hypothetical protein
VGYSDTQREILDRRSNAVSYKAVFTHPYQNSDGSQKKIRLVAYFVFFFSPLPHPTPLKRTDE